MYVWDKGFWDLAPVLLVCVSSGVIHIFSLNVLDVIFGAQVLLPALLSFETSAPSWRTTTVPRRVI